MKDTTTADIAPFQTRLGSKPPCMTDDEWEKGSKYCKKGKSCEVCSLNEATVATGVAGIDTRFGGASFEPQYFEERPSNDVIKNEKVFYSKNNKSILLPGWEYVDDWIEQKQREDVKTFTKLSSLRFSDEEAGADELEDMVDKTEDGLDVEQDAVEHKQRTGINWELDYKGRYKEHLRRLKKVHNI